MASVAVILGGMVGFFSALVSLVLFNASWLFALGLWSLGGLGAMLVLIALTMDSHRPAPEIEPEHA